MHPPIIETNMFIVNNARFASPVATIDIGSKPRRPKTLMKKILPNTPAMVFPITPNENFFVNRCEDMSPYNAHENADDCYESVCHNLGFPVLLMFTITHIIQLASKNPVLNKHIDSNQNCCNDKPIHTNR